MISLGVTLVVYVVVGLVLVLVLGAALASAATPLAAALEAVGVAWAELVVRMGAAVAALGAFLALMTGVSRTPLAMARELSASGVGLRRWTSGATCQTTSSSPWEPSS